MLQQPSSEDKFLLKIIFIIINGLTKNFTKKSGISIFAQVPDVDKFSPNTTVNISSIIKNKIK